MYVLSAVIYIYIIRFSIFKQQHEPFSQNIIRLECKNCVKLYIYNRIPNMHVPTAESPQTLKLESSVMACIIVIHLYAPVLQA